MGAALRGVGLLIQGTLFRSSGGSRAPTVYHAIRGLWLAYLDLQQGREVAEMQKCLAPRLDYEPTIQINIVRSKDLMQGTHGQVANPTGAHTSALT